MSLSYYAKNVLLEDGWAKDVLINLTATGIIASVETNTSKPADAELITNVLIPGMSNLHSHAFQRGFAGMTESRADGSSGSNDSFWTWRKIMYQFVDNITADQAAIIAKQLYIEMLQSGYTSVGEFHYLHHDTDGNLYDDPAEMSHSVINAARDVGIAITHLPVYYRYSGFNNKPATTGQRRFIHQPDEYFQLLDRLFKEYSKTKNVQLGIAPHSLRAVSTSDINDAIDVLDKYDAKAPIHIHIAEQMAEVDDCIAHSGQRPIQHLLDKCDVNSRWCLIHATHVNEQELWELAESKAVVGLCLTTEANLGDGFFPADSYFLNDGQFGIGSDSHISISPTEELKLLEYGQRLQKQKRAVLCSSEQTSVGRFLYQRAAIGGAQAIARRAGKIAVGYHADWLVLDGDNPAMYCKSGDQLLDAMIFSSNNNPIKDVMVSGSWVIKSGQHSLQEESLRDYHQTLKELVN